MKLFKKTTCLYNNIEMKNTCTSCIYRGTYLNSPSYNLLETFDPDSFVPFAVCLFSLVVFFFDLSEAKTNVISFNFLSTLSYKHALYTVDISYLFAQTDLSVWRIA